MALLSKNRQVKRLSPPMNLPAAGVPMPGKVNVPTPGVVDVPMPGEAVVKIVPTGAKTGPATVGILTAQTVQNVPIAAPMAVATVPTGVKMAGVPTGARDVMANVRTGAKAAAGNTKKRAAPAIETVRLHLESRRRKQALVISCVGFDAVSGISDTASEVIHHNPQIKCATFDRWQPIHCKPVIV